MHEHIHTCMHGKEKKGREGWVGERLGSKGKGTYHQTRRPEFKPWDPMWKDRNNSTSCSVTSTWVPGHAGVIKSRHMCMHIHTTYTNIIFKNDPERL